MYNNGADIKSPMTAAIRILIAGDAGRNHHLFTRAGQRPKNEKDAGDDDDLEDRERRRVAPGAEVERLEIDVVDQCLGGADGVALGEDLARGRKSRW